MRLGPPKVLCKDPKPAEASGFHVERVTPSAEHRSDPLGWRHAGIQTAAPNTTGTTMKTTGSCALTPERKLSSGRDKAQAAPNPSTTPIPARLAPHRTIIFNQKLPRCWFHQQQVFAVC